jgi:hypothetical protein
MFKKALTYFFVAVFAISVTGVSLQLHNCLSGGKTSYSFYPEYFGAKRSCCCNAINYQESELGLAKSQLREVPCCSNNHILYKIPTFQNQRAGIDFTKLLILIPTHFYIEKPTFCKLETPLGNEYRPPPLNLAGISFIRFSHHYKIPPIIS